MEKVEWKLALPPGKKFTYGYALNLRGFLMLISKELKKEITCVDTSDSAYWMKMTEIDLPL